MVMLIFLKFHHQVVVVVSFIVRLNVRMRDDDSCSGNQ